MSDDGLKEAPRSAEELAAERDRLVEQMDGLRGRSGTLEGLRSELLSLQGVIEQRVRTLATEEAKLQSRKRALAQESRELGRRKSEYVQSLGHLMTDYHRIEKEFKSLDAELRQQRAAPLPPPPPPPAVPTPAVTRPGANGEEQQGRQAPRLAVAVDVDMESDNCFYAGMTENLSEGGLFVATYDTFPIGTEVDVTITLLELPPIHAHCEVRWIRHEATSTDDYAPGMGIRFVELPEEDRRMIAEFLQMREPFFIDGV